jgi:ATP/ADP translocase
MSLITLDNWIHEFYFIMAGLFGLLLLRGLFRRDTRRNIVYDIVYAYTIIPFLLRALRIK